MNMLNFFKNVIKPFKLILVGIAICVCANAAAISLFHLITKHVVDALSMAFVDMSKIGLAYKCVFFLIATVFLYDFSGRARDYLQLQMIPKLRKHIIDMLCGNTLSYMYEYFQGFTPTKFVYSVFQSSDSTADIFIDYAADFLKMACSLLFSCILLFSVNTNLGYFAIIWILVWNILCFILAVKTNKMSYKLADLRSSLSSRWTNTFDNIESVFVYNGAKKELEKNQTHSFEVMTQEKKLATFLLKIMSTQSFVVLIISSAIFFYMLSLFKVGLVTPGDFVLVAETIHAISSQLWEFSQDLSWLMTDIGRIRQSLDMCKTREKPNKINSDIQKINFKNYDVKAQNIAFAYGDKEIFSHDGELKIEQGKTVALVGSSGSGKTTFIKLMLGLISPQQGQITLGQNSIQHMNPHSLRDNFALIPQDPKLFVDTVLNNIRYGSFDAIKEEVIAAAKKAQIHEFIETLPNQYETTIENTSLSGGQRQRLMIARGLLRDAKIFIFDESTSALDTITEKDILNAIKDIDSSKTKFIIAHRIYTIKNADIILVFHNGRIIQQGTHEELVKVDDLYKKLYEIQLNG